MRIALASDHAGYKLKSGVIDYLGKMGVPFTDFGCGPEEKVDYVDYGIKAVEAVKKGNCDRAIMVCGTGLGMAMVANKYKGIRATPCCDEYVAEMSRKHNNSNCLTLGGRVLPLDEALLIVETWLETPFEAGRHAVRLTKLTALEEKNFR